MVQWLRPPGNDGSTYTGNTVSGADSRNVSGRTTNSPGEVSARIAFCVAGTRSAGAPASPSVVGSVRAVSAFPESQIIGVEPPNTSAPLASTADTAPLSGSTLTVSPFVAVVNVSRLNAALPAACLFFT